MSALFARIACERPPRAASPSGTFRMNPRQ